MKAGLENAFVDVGWIEETDLPKYLASADVGIYLMEDTLLNRTKCPVKLADMQALGVPVVAEAVGQVTEYVIAGETGLLRASGDYEGVAADLVRLLQNQEERQRMGSAAMARVQKRFSWDNLAESAEKAYRSTGRL